MWRFAVCLFLIGLAWPSARAGDDANDPGDFPGPADDLPNEGSGGGFRTEGFGGTFASGGDTHDAFPSFWAVGPAEDQPVLSPWGEWLTPPTTTTDLVEALVLPEVSGNDLAAKAELFRRLWADHLRERAKVASLLAELAAFYEKGAQYDKALALYERLWDEFPEQQKLIGEIKREHALADVEIDLSTPQAAFLTLKRALLTYKLTAATFGVTDAGTVIYQPRMIEHHEFIEWRARTQEEMAASGQQAEEKPIGRWPEPELTPWGKATRYLWGARSSKGGKPITGSFDGATLLDVVEAVRRSGSFPITITPAARAQLQKRKTSLRFRDVRPSSVLQLALKEAEGRVRIEYRPFRLLLYCLTLDEPQPFVTNVIQSEPWGEFPDDVKPGPQTEVVPGMLRFFLGLDAVPDAWFVYLGHCVVVTAPLQAIEGWFNSTSTIEAGRYYGRVDPLLRCLRGYPLPGPAMDPSDARPGDWYTYVVQVRWQVRRMQHFLSDRLSIAVLLQADLISYKQHAPNRFEPDIGLDGVTDLGTRLGLWFDGKCYRFLVFDSRQDRERWLKGETWVDIPSDLEQFIKDMQKEAEEAGEETGFPGDLDESIKDMENGAAPADDETEQ